MKLKDTQGMTVLTALQLGIAIGALNKTEECLKSWQSFVARGGSISRYRIAKLRKWALHINHASPGSSWAGA